MNKVPSALIQVADAMDSCRLAYVVIGGVAAIAWGVPRTTLDIDVTVWTEPALVDGAIDCLLSRFQARAANAHEFVRQTNVLLLRTAQGIEIDVIFGRILIQQDFVSRGVEKEVEGRKIRFVTAEDLLLMKLSSERDKDQQDARTLLRVTAETLDRSYLEPKLAELAESLARPEILEEFRRAFR